MGRETGGGEGIEIQEWRDRRKHIGSSPASSRSCGPLFYNRSLLPPCAPITYRPPLRPLHSTLHPEGARLSFPMWNSLPSPLKTSPLASKAFLTISSAALRVPLPHSLPTLSLSPGAPGPLSGRPWSHPRASAITVLSLPKYSRSSALP